MSKLCIDPGHGFSNRRQGVYDPGAEAAGFNEADIVLQWGLSGKWILGQLGIPIWLTREDDRTSDPVGTRDDRAEQAGCTHFLSLHLNDASPSASGTETYYRDAADRAWALKVHGAALHALGLKDRGLKLESSSQHTRLAVFDFDGPACLVEFGFISNAGDRRKLLERDRRILFWQRVAEEFV